MTNKELQAEVDRLTAELKSAAETLGATEIELKNCREQRRALEDQLRLIMETYNVEPPAGILDTINGLLAAKDAEIERLHEKLGEVSVSAEESHADYKGACVTIAAMHAAALGEVTGPRRGIVEDVADVRARLNAAEEALSLVLKTAPTQAPATPPVDPEQPPMEPDKGDLTPDVVWWRLKNWALIEVQQHYAGREQHLPDDLRAALKGGA